MYADRLVHLRKSRGLTQKEVADKLKISRSSYAQYELGRRRPDYETLIGIANLYDVSIDYLLGRTDDPRPPSSEQTPENKTSATSTCSKDPYQQMIDEAIAQLNPEEHRIIEKIRSMPDLDLQFKDFESDPVQNLRDLVKIWREIHLEDFEDKQKIPNVPSAPLELKKKLKIDDHTIDREVILSHLEEIERRLDAIERHLALITGFGLEELFLLRRLKERPEIISLLMQQLRQGLEK